MGVTFWGCWGRGAAASSEHNVGCLGSKMHWEAVAFQREKWMRKWSYQACAEQLVRGTPGSEAAFPDRAQFGRSFTPTLITVVAYPVTSYVRKWKVCSLLWVMQVSINLCTSQIKLIACLRMINYLLAPAVRIPHFQAFILLSSSRISVVILFCQMYFVLWFCISKIKPVIFTILALLTVLFYPVQAWILGFAHVSPGLIGTEKHLSPGRADPMYFPLIC